MKDIITLQDQSILRTLADLKGRAFDNDPLMGHIFSNRSNRVKKISQLYFLFMKLGFATGRILTTPFLEASAILYDSIGKQNPSPQLDTAILPAAFRISLPASRRALQYDNFTAKQRNDLIHRDHIYINSHATDPQFQGQGFGGALLKEIIEESQKRMLPLYLEAGTNDNVSLYQHFGFQTVKEFCIPQTNIKMSAMIREVN